MRNQQRSYIFNFRKSHYQKHANIPTANGR